jgi:hypothetical protein
MPISRERLTDAVSRIKDETILDTNLSQIKSVKNNVLQQLQLSREKLQDFHKRLERYRYIDEIIDIDCGDYVRWIDLDKSTEIKLAMGAFVCDVEINTDGMHIKLRSVTGRYIQLRMDEIMLFRKMTDDELVVLSAMKYLDKCEK